MMLNPQFFSYERKSKIQFAGRASNQRDPCRIVKRGGVLEEALEGGRCAREY
jgi:hypothetical protein